MMAAFMDKNFMLDTATAQRLYHDVAAELPIIDYHSHLQQSEIAARKKFRNMAELWLGGDHYKWRLMRSAAYPKILLPEIKRMRRNFMLSAKYYLMPSVILFTTGAILSSAVFLALIL